MARTVARPVSSRATVAGATGGAGPSIEEALASQPIGGKPVELARTSFYLGRETILPRGTGRMAKWRKRLFSIMSRVADPATLFYELPPNRVIELGKQVAL